jgi:hypothetical protein
VAARGNRPDLEAHQARPHRPDFVCWHAARVRAFAQQELHVTADLAEPAAQRLGRRAQPAEDPALAAEELRERRPADRAARGRRHHVLGDPAFERHDSPDPVGTAIRETERGRGAPRLGDHHHALHAQHVERPADAVGL